MSLTLDLPSVVESQLTAAAAARLPDAAAPAPWTATLEGAFWLHRAMPAARQLVQGELRGRPALPVTVAAVIRYLEGPVGPYSEVLASPVLLVEAPLPAVTVPFIAVDSAASVLGGRENWALPKVFAEFAWAGDFRAVHVRGEDTAAEWSLNAVTRPRRRELAFRLPLRARQPAPGGLVPVELDGTLQAATVEVDAHGPSLAAWLRAGRHPGVLVRARATFGPPVR